MDIFNRAAKSIEDLFAPFEFKLDEGKIKHPVCIALENLGGDDTRAVYAIYFDDKPRFFGVSSLEFTQTAEAELEWMKQWAQPSEIQLIEAKAPYFLFELVSPFGVTFNNT